MSQLFMPFEQLRLVGAQISSWVRRPGESTLSLALCVFPEGPTQRSMRDVAESLAEKKWSGRIELTRADRDFVNQGGASGRAHVLTPILALRPNVSTDFGANGVVNRTG
jgi:hypothetical protein